MFASESKVYIALVSGAEVCYALGSNHLTTVADKEWLEKSEQRAGGGHSLSLSIIKKIVIGTLIRKALCI